MDGLFFIASKTLGMLARVETWFVILLALALLAGAAGRHRAAHRLTAVVLVLFVVLAVFPLGTLVLRPLEMAHPANPALPDRVDGIIVLGGAEDTGPYAAWGLTGMNEAAERMTAGVELARRFPQAKLIFVGGSAEVIHGDPYYLSASMTRQLWLDLGVPEAQIVVEDRSRNTSENALFARALLKPQPGQVWVLVTSAFHMPRSVEVFGRNGWQGIIPWPVDFRSGNGAFRAEWKFADHLQNMNVGLKEILGLAVYRIAGK